MDDGTKGGVPDGAAHVWWPAVDPWVTAVGGTTIGDISGSSFDEITWNDNGITSGGISTVTDTSGNLVFPLPSWQVGANVPPSINNGTTRGRGIPDIAGYANGYATQMFGKPAGTWWGTSEAAPFYAGLVAILNATLGSNLGYLNPLFYALAQDARLRHLPRHRRRPQQLRHLHAAAAQSADQGHHARLRCRQGVGRLHGMGQHQG